MSDPATTQVNLANIARAALRHLAVNRMAPTPQNYAAAWEQVGGEPSVDNGPPTQPLGFAAAEFADPGASGRANLVAEAAEAVRMANRRLRTMQAMSELLETICEIVPEVAWAEEWLGTHFEAIHKAVSADGGRPDRGALVQARNELRLGAISHARARDQRRDALTELKSVLPQWLSRVSSLSDSSREFGDKMDRFSVQVQSANSLEDLAQTLTGIVADTDRMRDHVNATRIELSSSVERAEALENRVARLSDEMRMPKAPPLHDEVTGLLNRRGLDAAFVEAWSACLSDSRPLSVVVLGIDSYAANLVNCGQSAKQQMLRDLARRIQAEHRPEDKAARIGVDEFVLVLPGVEGAKAVEVIERLQRGRAGSTMLRAPQAAALTFSAGICLVTDGDLKAAIERGEDALDEARRNGTAQIVTID